MFVYQTRLDYKENQDERGKEKGHKEGSPSMEKEVQMNYVMEEVKVNQGVQRSAYKKPKISNLTESKYRFLSQRRPDSFLSISERNYHLSKKGQSTHYVNSRTGDRISIRAATESRSPSKMNNNIKDLEHVSQPEQDLVEESHISGSNHLGARTVRALEIKACEDIMMTIKQSGYKNGKVGRDLEGKDLVKVNEMANQQTTIITGPGRNSSLFSRLSPKLV